jgi:hypothetical protein
MRTAHVLDTDKITVRLLLLITRQVGKPCPTRNQIRAHTGLPKDRVWAFVDELHAKGIIEVEERAIRPGNWRRMRIAGGRWTDWTDRRVKKRRYPLKRAERSE